MKNLIQKLSVNLLLGKIYDILSLGLVEPFPEYFNDELDIQGSLIATLNEKSSEDPDDLDFTVNDEIYTADYTYELEGKSIGVNELMPFLFFDTEFYEIEPNLWQGDNIQIILLNDSIKDEIDIILKEIAENNRPNQSNSNFEINYADDQAFKMGLLPDSRTFKDFVEGYISYEEAVAIGDYTRQRHQDTNYDELLRSGIPKDVARELIKN